MALETSNVVDELTMTSPSLRITNHHWKGRGHDKWHFQFFGHQSYRWKG